MKLLFLPQNSHQNRYFSYLSEKFSSQSVVFYYAKFFYGFRGSVDEEAVQKALIPKLREVENKYPKGIKQTLYKTYLSFTARRYYRLYKALIRQEDPSIVAVWNGIKFPQSLAVETAKEANKKVLFFENGFMPDTTALDFKGINAGNSVPREASFYDKLTFNTPSKLPQKLEVREKKGKQKETNGELPSRYLFIPFQVNYDSQIIYYSPWIKDMYALFDLISETAKACEEIVFVFKEHPSDRASDYTSLHEKAKASKNVRFLNHIDTQTLIQNAEAVATINSSVGIEALLFEKKVCVLGDAFFSIEGITKPIRSKEALIQAVENLERWKVDKVRVTKFLRYLYERYLVPSSWKHPSEEHIAKIEEKIEYAFRTV